MNKTTTTTTTRLNKFDNLKGLAIFLIVLGHMCFLTNFKSVDFLHNFLFIIHLPIFFFVAGYFSKIGPNEPIKAFKRLAIPYFVFCIIFELYSIYYLGNSPNSALFINSGYALWFLISLFTMKLLLPIFNKFRYPILIAFILSILIGYIDSDVFGISRTFAYMPIFLIGFYYKDYKSKLESNYPKINKLFENKILIILIFIITILACVITAYVLPYKFILLKNSFD